jgi:hypothetical protein
MTIEETQRTLSDYDFKVGRILSETNDSPPRADKPNWVIRNAGIVTKIHGIVWRGDLELTYEGHELGCAAREIGENLFVVEAAAAPTDDESIPMNLIKQAVWWTSIAATDADYFTDIESCILRLEAGDESWASTVDAPGSNWAGKILFSESFDQREWQQQVATHRGRRVMPRLYHRAGPYELVWFDHKKAVLFHDYCALLRRFGKIELLNYPDQRAICTQKEGQVVALLWPSPVPNPDTASAGIHELAMRRHLGRAETLTSLELRDLLTAELRPAMSSHDARKLFTAAARIMYLLEGSHPTDEQMYGCTEWSRCPGTEIRDGVCEFMGAQLPVGYLFRDLAAGGDVESFAARWSSIDRQQIVDVITFVADSIEH